MTKVVRDIEFITERVLESLREKYVREEDNLIIVDKFFFITGLVREVVEKRINNELDDEQCRQYFIHIEKYLSGEIEMFREDGEVKVKVKTNYEEERRKAIESLKEAYKKMLGDPEQN